LVDFYVLCTSGNMNKYLQNRLPGASSCVHRSWCRPQHRTPHDGENSTSISQQGVDLTGRNATGPPDW